jgi:Protein of unknown function (DUF2934)
MENQTSMPNRIEHSFQTASPGKAMGPDTAQPTATQIAALAYELWKARGCPEGSPDADWLRAEEQLKTGSGAGEKLAA